MVPQCVLKVAVRGIDELHRGEDGRMLECVARGQTLGAGGPVVREEGGDAAASPRSNIDMQRSVAVTLVGRQHPEHLCKRNG